MRYHNVLTAGLLVAILMVSSGLSMSKNEGLSGDDYARRRSLFLDELRDLNACAILHAAPEFERNHDVNFPYRQNSDLWYLSGWDQAHTVLVLTPVANGSGKAEVTFFSEPRNPAQEIWTGARAGLQEIRSQFGVDTAFAYAEFFERYPKLIRPYEQLVFSDGGDRTFNDHFQDTFREMWQHPPTVREAGDLLQDYRVIKSESELESIEHAVAITGAALTDAFKKIPALSFEYEVQAEIEYGFKRRGAVRLAFPSIVGAGEHSTVLHYEANRGPLKPGDMLLMDVGSEWNYYAADITRTVPVSGTFSPEQAAIYQLVLDAQTAAIASVKPGVSFRTPHNTAAREITCGLVKLGLLQGDADSLYDDGAYRRFFMHGTSHWLGLDVHDVGRYSDPNGPSRTLRPGMVFTVEPGIYITSAGDIDEKWWYIGVRIEDDVLVTPEGGRILSAGIPKTIPEIEAIMRPD